jgi:hypothetical protein
MYVMPFSGTEAHRLQVSCLYDSGIGPNNGGEYPELRLGGACSSVIGTPSRSTQFQSFEATHLDFMGAGGSAPATHDLSHKTRNVLCAVLISRDRIGISSGLATKIGIMNIIVPKAFHTCSSNDEFNGGRKPIPLHQFRVPAYCLCFSPRPDW